MESKEERALVTRVFLALAIAASLLIIAGQLLPLRLLLACLP